MLICLARGPRKCVKNPRLSFRRFRQRSGLFFQPRRRLPDFALRHRMPSAFINSQYAQAGGLLSYGPGFTVMFACAAGYVDRIASGAKPAELPIEQPTKSELVVNLKTAKALPITIPPSILLRADKVIE